MDISQDVASTIGRIIQQARTEDTQQAKRSDLFDRFMGEPYGDEVEGRSQFISTDAADVVSSMLPDILDVFVGAEDIVVFKPVGPEDEEAAKQETDVVSHMFWQENDGFMVLHTALMEGLIAQNSYIKSSWEEKERVTIEEYDDLTPEELQVILAQLDGEYEFLELGGLDEQTGMPTGEPIRAKIRCVKTEKQYKIVCVPQEEVLLTPRWPHVSLAGVPCVAHKRDMERGELRRMGFTEESIDRGGNAKDTDDWQETTRHDTRDYFADDTDRVSDDATRLITVYEAYVRADVDDDGKAELVRVWAVGDGSDILEVEETGEPAVEEVSHHPFSAFTPYPVPHRHVGRSAVEQVDDIQKVKTALLRSTLDNIYANQYARPIVDVNGVVEETFQDLANPDHGSPIRVDGPGAVTYQQPPMVGQTTLPLLQVFDDLKELRTGAVRYADGLDANSLNKTASGLQKIMDAAAKRRQLVARVFAETGLRDLFLRIHADLRNGPLRELAVKLRGGWVQVNPRAWLERTDMIVQVGTGQSDRDEKRTGLMLMAQTIEKLMMDPEIRQSGLIGYPQIRALAEKTMETFGFETIDEFMPPAEAAQPQQQEQGPDPAQQMQMQMMQMQVQAMQIDMQAKQQRLELDRQEAAQKYELERRKIDLQHQRELERLRLQMGEAARKGMETQADILAQQQGMELDREKAVMEDDYKRDKLETDALTGFMRQGEARVRSEPPLPYGEVMRPGNGN